MVQRPACGEKDWIMPASNPSILRPSPSRYHHRRIDPTHVDSELGYDVTRMAVRLSQLTYVG
jgi:hypothetical protein